MKIYLVGGAVRDILLNKEPKDLDYVVVGATPEYFLNLNYEQVGNSFPVFLHPETGDEYALARKERKIGKGYNGFEFNFDSSVTLEDDLFRRDLTINAMAMDLETKEIIDPYNGQKDLKNKVINPVSEHFKEDPVRVLRAARFSATLQYSLSEKLITYTKEIKNMGELEALTGEQVFKELTKVFKLTNPGDFFHALYELDVMDKVFSGIEVKNNLTLLNNLRSQTDNFDMLYAMLVRGNDKELVKTNSLKNRIPSKAVKNFSTLYMCENLLKDFPNEESVLSTFHAVKGLKEMIHMEEFMKAFNTLGFHKEVLLLRGLRGKLMNLDNAEIVKQNPKKAQELIKEAQLKELRKLI